MDMSTDFIQQRTDAWVQQRLGKATASRIADLMATTKTGYGASRANYLAELICERLTGRQAERYVSNEMLWGTEKEPEARASYSFLSDTPVMECGFVEHKTIAGFGASPDGLVGDDGLVEIKAPNSSTHIDFLLTRTIPGKYVTQMQAQMSCTGRKFCDFVSFDPRLPAEMHLFIKRVERDDAFIAKMEDEVRSFLGELEGKVSNLKTHYGVAA
jgi:putative phage-type endonuclease